MKTLTISEFGLICQNEADKDSKFLSDVANKAEFERLAEFAKSDNCVLEFAKNGRCLKAKSYVGLLYFGDFAVEILPKIAKSNDESKAKEVLIKLLKILYKLPKYKDFKDAQLGVKKNMPLLEIFISMFLHEVLQIIKYGLKSDYKNEQENVNFLKGKLIFRQHLKENLIRKERFFCEFSDYNQNRAENRVLKTALLFLHKISSDFKNKRLILQSLSHFEGVEMCANLQADFAKISTQRDVKYYQNALIWSRIFLNRQSFQPFLGSTNTFAILFPMQILFESFVGWWLRKSEPKCEILEQHPKNDFVKGLFGVKPDFVALSGSKTEFIADAKWKIIANDDRFSQSDFYQIFAYQKMFACGKARLYYPKIDTETDKTFHFFDQGEVEIYFLDILKELEIYD